MSTYEQIIEIMSTESDKRFTITDLAGRTLMSQSAVRQSIRIGMENGKINKVGWNPSVYQISPVGQAAYTDNLSKPYIINEGFVIQIQEYIDDPGTMPGGPNGSMATLMELYKKALENENPTGRKNALVKVLQHYIIFLERDIQKDKEKQAKDDWIGF